MFKFKYYISVMIVTILINQLLCPNAVASELRLNALSACLYDAQAGRVLYEENGRKVRQMASTTKIMTCIIALENSNYEDVVTVSSYASKMPDVQMNAKEGEQYKMKDLLHAMMLESYNDVAVAIAEHVAGDVESFANLMNKKALELGCTDTYFVTPNGLDGTKDGKEHASTAVDMAKIAAYAIKNPEFIKITNKKSHQFSEINGKRSVSLNNKNLYLDMMEGAIGVKTGFTSKAGYCFVGALKKDGKTFISVVLGSGWPPHKNYKWKDTCVIMKYALKNYDKEIIYKPEDEFDKVFVSDGLKKTVKVYTDKSVELLIGKDENVSRVYHLKECVTAPVEKDDVLGYVEMMIDGETYITIPVKAKETVNKITYTYFAKKLIKKYFIAE